MKNIVLKQKAERDMLVDKNYQQRVEITDSAAFLASGLIKLITGPRRAGKSVLALQTLQGKNYAYLNFDDNSLLNHFDEDEIMKALSEVYPGYQYLLLDEIQNLDGWDTWVAKLYRRGVNLVITGSNANMLSSEMATLLTGRYIESFILPFSMKETLQFRKVDTSPVLPEGKATLYLAMEEYMKNGGYPEIIRSRELEQAYLGSLFDSIILKDVAKRHKIRKTTELYELADYLISNYSNPLSYTSIASELNLGSVTTVKKFCKYLEEPYLFWFLPRFDKKLKEMKKADRKVYVVDNGFISTRSLELSSNNGRHFENMVFVELLRRGYSISKKELFYYHTTNGKEIDFVTKKGTSILELIQVSYDIYKTKTRQRELESLVTASEELKCNNLTLITWNTNETIDYKGKNIRIVSVKNWFLNHERC